MTLTVVYDAQCALCVRCRTWMESEPALVPLTFLASNSAEARRRLGALPWLGQELIVIADDGRGWVGPAAFVTCLWALERWRSWALDLAGTPSWRQLAPAGIPPRGRDGANGAYDATNDRLVVACGQGTNDLWTLTFPDAPPAATPPDRTAWQGFGAARGQIPVPALELSANTAHGRVSFAVQLPSADPATLSLFDVAGRCVWSTPVGDPGAGAYELEISAPPQPPAIYFARLSQGKATRYARIVLMR